jgi:ribosomal protein S18 acetylase RimI-like enzyme
MQVIPFFEGGAGRAIWHQGHAFVEALDGGSYWPFAFVRNGTEVCGYGEVEHLFHPTRGMTARVNTMFGDPAFAGLFLDTVEERARSQACRAMYVSSNPGMPELNQAAMARGFDCVQEIVLRRFVVSQPSSLPWLSVGLIRPMTSRQYARHRNGLISMVSHGSYSASKSEVDEAMRRGAYRPIVLVENRRIVGYAECDLHHVRLSQARFMRLERIVIAPTHRGHGIGFSLVSSLVRDAHNLGCEYVELQAFEENTAAMRLYQRLGFFRTSTMLFAKTLS